MERFFFTFGSDGHPYKGGWTEVVAPDEETARNLFAALHPSDRGLRCACVYDEKSFKQTRMWVRGNYGARCREEIVCRVYEDG